ncbi:YHYH protein [Roseibium hamelinense]|uniref:YHYH protein n=1 Tax=Roseibium hamelinense TaxID=150831 RepID=A0A562TI08_9HYPH|nr:YHYH protein [Roseibium hamelinense]MTI45598.1 YHYH protein [Roseibium hamelinense]TWI93222.1 YHYH protein [Roseibium hamelinense]
MRKSLAIYCILASGPAVAHGTHGPIAGEQPVEPESALEQLMEIAVPEAEAAASFTVDGAYRYIRADGYPYKAPGTFPNRGNPHAIQKKNYTLKVPANPRKANGATSANGKVFGIALNGVVMEPGTAEFWQNNRRSGWNYEAMGGACNLGLDKYNAHVQPDGTYHYHGIPTGLMASEGGTRTPALLGYAADGFPIYGPYGYSNPEGASGLKKLTNSYRLKNGARPSGSSGPGGTYNGKFTQDWAYVAGAGDLDQCNGRFAVTPEYPQGTYHYVLTDSFPFIPRCWTGSPDRSFAALKRRADTGADGTATDHASGQEFGQADVIKVQHRPQPGVFGSGHRPPPPGRGQGRQRSGGGPCSGN